MDPGKVMNDGTVDEETGEMFDPDGNAETEDERDQRRTMLLVHYLTRSEAVKAERDAKRDATADEVSATLALLSKMAVAMVPKAPAAKLSPATKALSFVQENPFADGTTIWSDYRRDLIKRSPRTTTNTWVFSVAETLSLNILQRSLAPKSIRKPGQMEILRLSLFFAAPSSLGPTHL